MTHTKVTTEGTLSGFQEFFLQPIIKDKPNTYSTQGTIIPKGGVRYWGHYSTQGTIIPEYTGGGVHNWKVLVPSIYFCHGI